MNTTIFVPKIINVGYQNRRDTYTGKLAYVVYTDSKGELRKEASWNSWRDHNIEPSAFDNVPTSGFVLNKKVGDYVSDWNHRRAYCRVYDPRGFEFEITIENLLYILENANSIKGKGLEGEFVYGWGGKDLILIPTESPDYKEIVKYSNIIHKNETIKAKDLVVGATYTTKNEGEFVYIGKFDYYSPGYRWYENGECKTSKHYEDIPCKKNNDWRCPVSKIDHDSIDYLDGKYFWFARKDYINEYINGRWVETNKYQWYFRQLKSISNKFIMCSKPNCTEDYSEIYEAMTKTRDFSPRDFDNIKRIPYTLDEFKKIINYQNTLSRHPVFQSDSGIEYTIDCDKIDNLKIIPFYRNSDKALADYHTRFDFVTVEIEKPDLWRNPLKRTEKQIKPMTLEELYNKLKPSYEEVYLKNGYLYSRSWYYENKE